MIVGVGSPSWLELSTTTPEISVFDFLFFIFSLKFLSRLRKIGTLAKPWLE